MNTPDTIYQGTPPSWPICGPWLIAKTYTAIRMPSALSGSSTRMHWMRSYRIPLKSYSDMGDGRLLVRSIHCCRPEVIPWSSLCPGRLFSETTVFLVVSNILATLNIKKARDSRGEEITPDAEFVGGLARSVSQACAVSILD